MKQVNSFSARRHFFRNNRRSMRPLRPGMTPDGLEDSPEMANHNNGFGYFSGKFGIENNSRQFFLLQSFAVYLVDHSN
ncbi:hypothetical protein QR98_0100900 [Sarcoptes scabiei]|uniref:Uncharacterized protein n=1 Tax=Sarcoptes scabiei TaxID=52283 RepID=A0A132AKG9_SARSC|nr:hypothetical protein QR98_0100900 [Sarcoptes scabiei]